MDPLLAIAERRLGVDPGGETRVQVTVRNPGDLVEQYRFEVLGDASRWAQVVPRDVSVMPGKAEQRTVDVVFRPPPAPAAPAGEVPFGVRCVSLEHREHCAVVEGDVVVSAVLDLEARLHRVGSGGRYRLELRNTGSLPLTVTVQAVDDADLLRFAVAPATVEVPAGQTASVYVAARPRTARIIGKPLQHNVVVRHQVAGSDRSGEQQIGYEQRALVPRWVLVLLVLVLLVLLLVLAWVVLRPGAAAGPELRAGPPPGVALRSIAEVGPDSAELVWERSPYATSYEVQQLRDGGVAGTLPVEAPQERFTWTGLPAGESCLRVVPVNDDGRGPASQELCVVLDGPPPSGAATADPSGTPTDPAATESPAPTDGGSGSEVGAFEPQGWYVVYYRSAMDDQAIQDRARDVTAQLQGAGAAAVLRSSLRSELLEDGEAGFWYVLADGFDGFETAAQECTARAEVLAALETQCTVEPPG